MKTLLTILCTSFILLAACKKGKVVPGKINPPDSTNVLPPGPDPAPIDTFLGSYVDSAYDDGCMCSSRITHVGIAFTVQYIGSDTLVFKSLKELQVGGSTSDPYDIYEVFNDTFTKNTFGAYYGNQRTYYKVHDSLSVSWTYQHPNHFIISSCKYIGHKQ